MSANRRQRFAGPPAERTRHVAERSEHVLLARGL